MPDGVLKNMLEYQRMHELWDYHNPVWHPLVIGGMYARARAAEYLGNPVTLRVFDHTGWFACRSGITASFRSVTLVVPDSVDERVRRIQARNKGKKVEDWRKEKDWYRILTGQDSARRDAFAKMKSLMPDTKFLTIPQVSFWNTGISLEKEEVAQLENWNRSLGMIDVMRKIQLDGLAVSKERVRVKFAP